MKKDVEMDFENKIKNALSHIDEHVFSLKLSVLSIRIVQVSEKGCTAFLYAGRNAELVFKSVFFEEYYSWLKDSFCFSSINGIDKYSGAIHYDDTNSNFDHPFVIYKYQGGQYVRNWTPEHMSMYLDSIQLIHNHNFDYAKLYGGPKREKIEFLPLFEECLHHWETQNPEIFEAHRIKKVVKTALEYARSKQNIFDKLTRFSVIHGDSHKENIVFCPNKQAQLIDWEHCQIGDPADDIGYLVWPFDTQKRVGLTDEIERKIEIYAGKLNDIGLIQRYKLWQVCHMIFKLLKIQKEHKSAEKNRESHLIQQYVMSL